VEADALVSARDEILARVRSALADADRGPVPVDRAYRDATRPTDVLGLFAENVADYRAEVHRCAPDDVAATLAEVLGDRTTVVPDGFPWPVPTPVTGPLDATALDGVPAVVTTATVAIATTGTFVLTHGSGQGPRAYSLVPDLHVCVVTADQVVADVPDAVALLDPALPQTWVSGPSATSDIELDRVEGVHGPRTLHVVLVDA
jgi:L-lactate dehydrogenase complex protein LldG